MLTKALTLACLAAANLVSAVSMPTISAVGSKFFFSNGTQYYIKGKVSSRATDCAILIGVCPGVAYQLTDLDPLTNGTQCSLDARLMADLGANTIRVYHVDPMGNHDACMTAFANVGIYLFLDLDTFDTQFNQVGGHIITEYTQTTSLTFGACRLFQHGTRPSSPHSRRYWMHSRATTTWQGSSLRMRP